MVKRNSKFKYNDGLISAIILFAIFIITFTQIILRSVFNIPLVGVEELSRFLFIAFVFLGLPYYFRLDGHIKLEGIAKRLSRKQKRIIDIVIQSTGIIVFAVIAFSAFYTTISNYSSTTPTLSIPFWLFFIPTIFGFTLLTIEHVKKVIQIIKGEAK